MSTDLEQLFGDRVIQPIPEGLASHLEQLLGLKPDKSETSVEKAT